MKDWNVQWNGILDSQSTQFNSIQLGFSYQLCVSDQSRLIYHVINQIKNIIQSNGLFGAT